MLRSIRFLSWAAVLAVVIWTVTLQTISADNLPTGIEYQKHEYKQSTLGLHIPGEDATKTGVKWVRLSIMWRDIAPKPSLRRWEKADTLVKYTQANGVTPLFRIEPLNDWGVTDEIISKNKEAAKKGTPWLNGQYMAYPSNMKAYLAFVRDIVERYDGDGKEDMPGLKEPILLWEVLNEFDTRWLGPAKTLTQFFVDVKRTITGACPKAKLMHGGISFPALFAMRDGFIDRDYWFWDGTPVKPTQAVKSALGARMWKLIKASFEVPPVRSTI